MEAFPEVTFNIPEYTQRYNIAPTQPIPVIRRTPEGTLQADMLKWGLIPSWSKDPAIGSRLINARAETLAEKPSFRNAFKSRRCLILGDGFYEWLIVQETKKRLPIYFYLKTKAIFAFAGLWEYWRSPEGKEIRSATMITSTPNNLVGKFHDRMPVMLPRDVYQIWLDPHTGQSDLQSLLKPYPDGEMDCYPVSPLVNSPKNDSPEIVLHL
jgi:putative SOS response-associated peptidase YedK